MTILHETIEVNRTAADAFAYVSDFTTTVEWDATARAARKLTAGPVRVGTEFEVVCALPVGSVTLLYTVEKLEPNKRVELHGRSRFFSVHDTITFAATDKGTLLDYTAEFDFKPWIAPLAALSAEGLKRMGTQSVEGLRVALQDNFTIRQASFTGTADRLVLPGLSLFSRLGYKLARKHFNPLSASVKDKHMVITGATSGLGYATAMELARRGADLTLVARNRDKAEQAVADIKRETGNTRIAIELADLSLMADVDALINRLKRRKKPVDVLINNAGALFNPRAETAEGLEQSFALLLLGPYRLTEGLKPLLMAAPAPRVINVVSGGMFSQKLDVDTLIMPDSEAYSGSVAYARQKRALMVMTQEWATQWRTAGITVNAMHPGWADTPGVRDALPQFRALTRSILRSSEEGADTIVWLAAATEAASVSGKLFLDREVHTTHLVSSTRTPPQEREKLVQWLAEFPVGAAEGAKRALARAS
jgi:NAD(P)-dependent dehydrogenase (short-subunit alcohol dehydrogenase family)